MGPHNAGLRLGLAVGSAICSWSVPHCLVAERTLSAHAAKTGSEAERPHRGTHGKMLSTLHSADISKDGVKMGAFQNRATQISIADLKTNEKDEQYEKQVHHIFIKSFGF